jgi:hypothetical protein
MMGFDPLGDCKYIRLAHDLGLGCGDVREIEIVGDKSLAEANWQFKGPFEQMTFASKMQHKIYWGPLKGPVEWSLETWLAPWAYIASVLYHDLYWYPRKSKDMMRRCLESEWGRLFQNWGEVGQAPDGFPEVGEASPQYHSNVPAMLSQGIKVLGTCFREAPEFRARRRLRR